MWNEGTGGGGTKRVECSIGGGRGGAESDRRPVNENEKTLAKETSCREKAKKEMQQKDRVRKQPGCSSPALAIEGRLI